MRGYPIGSTIDKRWGAPLPDPDAPISGMQSAGLHVIKPGRDKLPSPDTDHPSGEFSLEQLEAGLGGVGVALSEQPEHRTDPDVLDAPQERFAA